MSIATTGDFVAILGKGAENYQEIKGVKHPYSDFEVVESWFKTTEKEKARV